MSNSLNIRCRDLGVDHDGYVTGNSMEDLIDCIIRKLAAQTGVPVAGLSNTQTRDIVRSALVQTCRPSATRSVDLISLIA